MRFRYLLAVVLALGPFSIPSCAVTVATSQDAELEDLVKKLGSEDFEEQGKAAKALEQLGRPVLSRLRKASVDGSTDIHVRNWCKRIIEKIEGRDERFEVLVTKLASADDEVNESAEEELIKIGRGSIPYLKPLLRSEDKNLRRRAVRILRAVASDEECLKWIDESPFPEPRGGAPLRPIARFGFRAQAKKDSFASQSCVLAALKWLARHQNSDGSWGARSYSNQCVGDKCAGQGDPEYDTGVTGLALLAFLGAGYSHLSKDEYPDPVRPDKILNFGNVVKNGLKWLLLKQDVEGCIGPRGAKYVYNHAIATSALSEAYGMSATQLFKGPAQQAVDFLIAAQNPGGGWRYAKRSGDNDSSVTGWAITALMSAELAELKGPFPEVYESAGKWFDSVTDTVNGYRVGYNAKTSGKVFVPRKNESFSHHETMTAIGVLCRMYMRKDKAHPSLGGVALLVKDPPEWKADAIDYYYWYHASMALFQYDGPDGPYWKKWIEPLKNALVPNQKAAADACANGSWNSEEDRWGFEGGRVYAVALNALTLETHYRYGPPLVRSRK